MPPVGRWPSIGLCFGPSCRCAAMSCVECAPSRPSKMHPIWCPSGEFRTLWLAKCGTCCRGFRCRRALSWPSCSSSGSLRARVAQENGPRAPSALRKCCPRLCGMRHSTRQRPKSVARRGCLEARPLVTRRRRADSPERPPPTMMRYIICNLFAPLYEYECVTHGSAARRAYITQKVKVTH